MSLSAKIRILLYSLILTSSMAYGQNAKPMQQAHPTFIDGSGSPCSGCQLYSYAAGTTTSQATYVDSSGTTQNTNPIILDAAGGANVWMGGSAYKFVLKDSLGTTVWTADNVTTYFPSSGGTINGNVVISGNLTVNGNFSFVGTITPSQVNGIAVVQNPTINQNISQPAGTSLNLNNFNGMALLYPVGLDPTGNTDDTTQINAAMLAAPSGITLPPGVYYVPGLPTASGRYLGVPISGDGHLLKSVNQQSTNSGGSTVTATKAQTDSYSDKYQYIIGREYLTHFEKGLMTAITGTYTAQSVTFSGDSTTVGVNVTPPYLVDQMFNAALINRGFSGVTVFNHGLSGGCTANWFTDPTLLTADILAHPDLYIIRWGINDSYCGETPTQTLSYIRQGLAQIRQSWNVDQMTVVLMMPSSTNDNPNGRNAAYYEQLRNGFVQAARDYQAVFVDTYAYLRDSDSAISSMDQPYQVTPGPSTPIIHIHPANDRNVLINSILIDAVLPSGWQQFASNNFSNIPGSQQVSNVVWPPNLYHQGLSIYRATVANGWPYEGSVVTFASSDGTWFQINYSYNSSTTAYATRASSSSSAWGSWIYSNQVLRAFLNTTSATSDIVSMPGMTVNGMCSIGAATFSASANIAGTWIATGTDQITVNHSATAGMQYFILCTRN